MNKLSLGSLAIILGALVLSLQLYGLKIIQGLEMTKNEWMANPMDYAGKPPITIALVITIGIIGYGIWLVCSSYLDKKKGE